MAETHLGETIDIHGGGQDLVFPHHENEIAQSVCSHGGSPFARYWMHNGFVTVEKRKMSKSLGNTLVVNELLKSPPGEILRYLLLSAHYRQPLDWSGQELERARRTLDRLYAVLRTATDRFGPFEADDRPCVIGRRRFGRISIANSDAAATPHTDAAIDEGVGLGGAPLTYTATDHRISGRVPIYVVKDGKILLVEVLDLKARWPEKWASEWLGW